MDIKKMKYIPVDKLIAEIEKRQEYLGDHNFHSMASEYDWLLTMVQSLQQEQPDPSGLNWIKLGRNVEITDNMFPLILRRDDGKLYIWKSKFWFRVWFFFPPTKGFYKKHVFSHILPIEQPPRE